VLPADVASGIIAGIRALVVLELVAGLRALSRMVATGGGKALHEDGAVAGGTIAVIVPVLNEERRLAPALAALTASGPELAEILVVDGGSSDGTRAVVARAAEGDPRVRLVDAAPTPSDWNGKAWNLEVGLRESGAPWIATVDADVRVGPHLLAVATARAERDDLAALSVATRQELPDAGAALLHPAFLTTLVYRFGLPNVVASRPPDVQANGQVFVARRSALVETDAFRTARASRCEDVTTARVLAAHGGRIGFYEGDAVVRMHESWRDCAANWPRSLTLCDGFVPAWRTWLSLAEVLAAQALPLPTLLALVAIQHHIWFAHVAIAIVFALVVMRAGVLAGTRRAYVAPPPWYWLSPIFDLPAVLLLAASMLRRTRTWRGRTLVPERSARRA
jgi:dolichol-phosphate mannosyltransferase